MNKYYYLKGDAQYGPQAVDELKTQITRETLVWREGMAEWTEAKNIPEVANILPPPIPTYGMPPQPPKKKEVELLKITYEPGKKRAGLHWWIIGGAMVILSIFAIRCVVDQPQKESTTIETIDETISETSTDEADDSRFIEDHQNKLEEDRKNFIILNWPKLITSKIHDYEKKNMGGFNYVTIQVNNTTEYTIDGVTCKVRYIKENGDTFKEEYVFFKSISAEDFQQLDAPGSERGTEVEVEIVELHSDQIGLAYSELR